VRETVRLDRLTPTADGYVIEQYGPLLTPGVTQVPLEAGLYHLRTLDYTQLRVLAGGVQVTSTSVKDKDPWLEPTRTDDAAASAVWAAIVSKGEGPCGRVPALSITYATEGDA
jgi:hypothetical protein